MPNQFFYWIKFDKDREPKLLISPTYEQLEWLIKREVDFHEQPYEWIIRDYSKR